MLTLNSDLLKIKLAENYLELISSVNLILMLTIMLT